MSFKSEFTLGSTVFKVLESRVVLNQETDITGRPTSVVRGGKATIKVEGSAINSKELFAWMSDATKVEDSVTLTYYSNDTPDKKDREVQFKKAYCVSFSESYKADTPMPYLIEFTVSSEIITDKHAEMTNDWPKK